MRLRELFARLRDRTRRDTLDAELAEEIAYHRQLLARDNQQGSAFGNATYYREETRAMWSLGILDDLAHDLRYATRALRRDAGFTIAVVLTLALGIGANTAAFSIVNGVMLRPLPYARADRLVTIWLAPTGNPSERDPTSLPDLHDWQQQARSFDGMAAYVYNRFDLNTPQGAIQARAILGTAGLYSVLGGQPVLGRMPSADEERSPVTAISYRLWQSQFGGSQAVLGTHLDMNGQPYTIIGVMPPGFHYPGPEIELWTTLYSIADLGPTTGDNPWFTSRMLHGYRTLARLRDGVTMATAEREMNTIEKRLAAAYPTIDDGTEIHLQSVQNDALGSVRRGLWTIFGAAALILLLACVNVAHLVLARLSSRTRELAVRRALGAHRGRIVRQLITESTLLGLVGGTAGIGVAFAGMRLLLRVAPGDIPRLENVELDARTLSFALALSLTTGLIFGVVPTVFGWGRGVQDALRSQGKGSARGQARARAILTAVEVAFAVVLLVGAGLMLRSFEQLTSADIGVHSAGASITQLAMIGTRYQSNDAKTIALDDMLSNIRAIPGVTAAGASTSMPPTRTQETEGFARTDRPAPDAGHAPTAIFIPATQDFWQALSIPVLKGRTFDSRDGAAAPQVAVVSRELVRTQFAGTDPIGHTINVSGADRIIVGVVGDAVYEGIASSIKPVIYVPYAQQPFAGVWIAIRSTIGDAALASGVRDAIHTVDATIPIHRPEPLEAMIADSVVQPRFQAWLFGTFGGLALVLATIGIYGVIAYGVARRRAEIGIRLALGAPRRAVVGMVVQSGMGPVFVGILAGLTAAWIGGGLIRGLLYGVPTTDRVTYGTVTVVLAVAGLVAAWVPARRAAAVDPLAAMRADG